jgi:hypothetical protein
VIVTLAEALTLAPSELTGCYTELDTLIGETRVCNSCLALRPVRGFLRVKGTRYVYLRCRACRARHSRERYHHSPEFRAREIARSWTNKQRKRAARAAEKVAELTPE